MFSTVQFDALPTGNKIYVGSDQLEDPYDVLNNIFHILFILGIINSYYLFSTKVILMNKMSSSASHNICYDNILTSIHSFMGFFSSNNAREKGYSWHLKRHHISQQVAFLAMSSYFL